MNELLRAIKFIFLSAVEYMNTVEHEWDGNKLYVHHILFHIPPALSIIPGEGNVRIRELWTYNKLGFVLGSMEKLILGLFLAV